LGADDVPLRDVGIVDGEVWVAAAPAQRDEAPHWCRRLHDGLAHNISLVIGKAVLGATAAGVPPAEIVRDALLYGATHRESWGVGLTTLTALADILPVLDDDDRYLALFHGIAAVADDCEGQPQRSAARRWIAGAIPSILWRLPSGRCARFPRRWRRAGCGAVPGASTPHSATPRSARTRKGSFGYF